MYAWAAIVVISSVKPGTVVLLRAVVPPKPEIKAGMEDAGSPAFSAAGITTAGMVFASRLSSVVDRTATATTEPKLRIVPLRPPAVPISSWVRSGKVVLQYPRG